MPTCHWSYISKIIDTIVAKQPNSILDIGVGNAKWGSLCREYLEVYGHNYWQKEIGNKGMFSKEFIEFYAKQVDIILANIEEQKKNLNKVQKVEKK